MSSAGPQALEALELSRRDQELREIAQALRGLQYGSILVVVQDGVVVQIDRTEKKRLTRPRHGEEQR